MFYFTFILVLLQLCGPLKLKQEFCILRAGSVEQSAICRVLLLAEQVRAPAEA